MSKLPQGITFQETPGHGYYYLSPERLLQLPENMRMPSYEEDCDWAIPFSFFRDELPQNEVKQAIETLKNWHPDLYEQMFNKKLNDEESYLRSRDHFYKENKGKWFVTAAWGDWHELVPEGFVGVCAVLCNGNENESRRTSEERYYLVPSSEYESREYSFIIDEAKHIKVKTEF